MLDHLSRNWWQIALRGVAAILIGILIFMSPATVLTFVAVFAIVDGVFGIIQALQHRTQRYWGWMLLEGVLGILLGIVILLNPFGAAIALTWLVGIWAIGTGIAEIVLAIRIRKEIQGEFWLGLAGVLSIVFGVIAFLFPLSTFLTLAWVAAIYAIVFGAMLILLAFRVRSPGGSSMDGRTPGTTAA